MVVVVICGAIKKGVVGGWVWGVGVAVVLALRDCGYCGGSIFFKVNVDLGANIFPSF